MTSNLGCIGLDTPDPAALGPILDRVVSDGTVVGRAGGVTTHQLTDPSGSRLTVGIRDMHVVDLLPAYAAVHVDADAFATSPASLLDRDAEPGPDARRFAAESFISYGAFAGAGQADGSARMAGVVLAASTHTVASTGQTFHAARVRTTAFEVDVCLAASVHPEAPAPGAVISGDVFLVASIPELWSVVEEPRRRRWFSRA